MIASIIKICCPYLLSSRKLYYHDRETTYLGHIVLEGSPVALGEVGLVTTCRQMHSAATNKVSKVPAILKTNMAILQNLDVLGNLSKTF